MTNLPQPPIMETSSSLAAPSLLLGSFPHQLCCYVDLTLSKNIVCLILAFRRHCGKSETGDGKIYLLVILIGSGYIILYAKTVMKVAGEDCS